MWPIRPVAESHAPATSRTASASGERQRAPDQCGRQAGPEAQEQREPQGAGEQQRQAHVGQHMRSRAVHEVAELEDAVGRRPGNGHQRGPLARHQLSAPHDQQHERRRRGEVARADRQRRRPAHEVVGEVAEIAEEKRVEERQVLAPVRQLTGEGERRGGEQQVRGGASRERDRRLPEEPAHAIACGPQPGPKGGDRGERGRGERQRLERPHGRHGQRDEGQRLHGSRTPWPSLGGHRRQDQEQRKAEAQRPLLRQGAHRVHACEDEHDRPHPQRQRG